MKNILPPTGVSSVSECGFERTVTIPTLYPDASQAEAYAQQLNTYGEQLSSQSDLRTVAYGCARVINTNRNGFQVAYTSEAPAGPSLTSSSEATLAVDIRSAAEQIASMPVLAGTDKLITPVYAHARHFAVDGGQATYTNFNPALNRGEDGTFRLNGIAPEYHESALTLMGTRPGALATLLMTGFTKQPSLRHRLRGVSMLDHYGIALPTELLPNAEQYSLARLLGAKILQKPQPDTKSPAISMPMP